MTRIKRFVFLLLAVSTAALSPAGAVSYLPEVTAEMTQASYWAQLHPGARQVILTQEEIVQANRSAAQRPETKVLDLTAAPERFDGFARNELVRTSATADARHYYGWTYLGGTQRAAWRQFEALIANCADPRVTQDMPVRLGIAVERTLLRVFPTDTPLLRDPDDPDFDYNSLSAVTVNAPLLLYTTSADGKFYLARSVDCSGWVAAEDVAVCADRQEWRSAWDLPSEHLLVVYGNKVYTDASYFAPDTARRMLTQGTALERVTDLAPDTLVGNRSPFHNHVVYLPVRRADGSYEKQMALIPETAPVSVGYLPLTQENIATVALNNLGDAYGWGGMLDVEDCSGLVRTVYACFGLNVGRNGNWQWERDIEKVDLTNASYDQRRRILDALPLGSALCFPGHEMMYLGKVGGKYYVLSAASTVISPASGKPLRLRCVAINTLDMRRANGRTWLQELDKAFMCAYAKLPGKSYSFPSGA